MNIAKMREHYPSFIGLAVIILSILAIPAYIGITQPIANSARVIQQQASTTCFGMDGAFTDCGGANPDEWSDVTPAVFPGSFLYAVDRDADPTRPVSNPSGPDTLFLMYDEVARTLPLGRDEFVTVNFKTVEIENGEQVLEHYTVNIFGDNSFVLIVDGLLQGTGRVNEIDDQRAAAGFGISPNESTPHVMAEFQIGLREAGFSSYAPDPLFWSSGVPFPPDLKCYNISPPDTPGNTVQLVDQFGTELGVIVGQSRELCVAAIKNNQPVSFQLDVKCYSIQGHDPPDFVDLDDQFHHEANVTVGPANLLCVTVKKTSVNPAAQTLLGNPPQYQLDLKCYQISGQAPSFPPVFLQTQFGNETNVSIGQPDRLCTPVTKSEAGSVGTPPASPLDRLHYKCYVITGQDDPHVVNLRDQFGDELNVNLGTPSRFCAVAVKKEVTPPTTPTRPDLKCYYIQDRDPGRTVDLETQFGAETNVKVGNATALCVVVSKNGATPPFQIDFKCYDITGEQPLNTFVDLETQFGLEQGVQVGPAIKLCAAVTKNPRAGDQPPPPLDLKCYSISGNPVNQGVSLVDQFHTESVLVVDPFMLCVSAVKAVQTTVANALVSTAPPNPSPIQLDFKCYNITPAQDPGATVNLQDQFGIELNVRVGPSFALCSAAKKTHLPPPPPPQEFELGLKCYNIQAPPTTVSPVPLIMDQFGNETNVAIGEPFALCNAAIKAPPGRLPPQPAPILDLKCYNIQGHDPKERIDLRDQFGFETNLDVGPAFALCIWVIKNGLSPQIQPFDLKCYTIFGEDPPVRVDLRDEFENETNVDVGQAFAVCSFAIKNPQPGQRLQPGDFKCYKIQGGDPPDVVNLDGQFGPEPNVVVGQAFAVCTNALKTKHLQPSDTDGDGVPDTTDNCVFTPNANQRDTGIALSTPNGVGDVCEANHATAAILQVGNSVDITQQGVEVEDEPSLEDQIREIVDYQCGTNATCRQEVAHQLLQSQVDIGLITQQQADQLENSIVGPPTPTFPYILPLAFIAAIILGTLVFYKRKRLTALTSSFFASILASFRVHRRNKRIT